jgi:DNA-directed RNA polymerase subunit beta'
MHTAQEARADRTTVRIALASPEDILSWSSGEVVNPETLNYRTGRPVRGGLFCEQMFGPEKDWECACGKYRGVRHQGRRCERCQVEVAHSRARRTRLGHIELAALVVHVWFFQRRPNVLGQLLDLKTAELKGLVYHQNHAVLDPGSTPLRRGELLTDEELRQARAAHGDAFEADTGGAAVARLLHDLDLGALERTLRGRLAGLDRAGQTKA